MSTNTSIEGADRISRRVRATAAARLGITLDEYPTARAAEVAR